MVPVWCRYVHCRGKDQPYSGNRPPLLTVLLCAKRFHRHYIGRPAVLNQHYRGTNSCITQLHRVKYRGSSARHFLETAGDKPFFLRSQKTHTVTTFSPTATFPQSTARAFRLVHVKITKFSHRRMTLAISSQRANIWCHTDPLDQWKRVRGSHDLHTVQ